MEVRIGSEIRFDVGEGPTTSKIISIEKVKPGSKYGRNVESADLRNDGYILDVECGKWVKEYQVKSVVKF